MRALALGLVLISGSVFACPNLAGKYAVCRSVTGTTSGSSNLEVTQKVVNRATEFTIVSTDDDTGERVTESFRADGKNYVQTETDPDSGIKMSVATQVSCAGAALKARIIVKYENEVASTVNMTVTKRGKVLTQVLKGDAMGEPINDTIHCE